MNIYIIIFIIIIPISIFLLSIVSDNSFKERVKNLKREFNKLSTNFNNKDSININSNSTNNRTKFVNSIGSNFGYGRELFTCDSGGLNLPDDVCNLREKSIGIKFHTFKMTKNYNVPAIDDVKLNDYCTQDYLEKNFVNVLNNIWLKSGLTFYFSDLIKENEVDNLTKYYNFSIIDQTIFPDCSDIVDFLDNPYEFDKDSDGRTIPDRTTPQVTTGVTFNVGDVSEIFKYKDIPTVTTSLPEHLNGVQDEIITEEKQREMAEIDINTFKMLTSRTGFINNINEKKIMRNIFYRMTNEENYINDTDMHIYLVPYIHDDIAILVEGRNNRPMLLISLYYQDCKKIEKTIENIYSEHTRKYWLDRLTSNFKQLKELERQYNETANIDIVPDPNNACSAGIFDPSPSINTTLNVLRATEAVMVSEIDDIKERGITDPVSASIDVDIDKIQKRIEINTNNMIKIYEYDYNNNHEVKILKKYKNKRMPMVMGDNGTLQEQVFDYEQLKRDKINELKEGHRRELDRLEAELSRDVKLLEAFNIEIDSKKIPLEAVRQRIRDIVEPKRGDINYKLLKKLKEMISNKKGEISSPMYYAEKVRYILNINRLITGLFGHNSVIDNLASISHPDETLRELDKEVPICDLLDKLLTLGGINVNNPKPTEESIKEISLNANGSFNYLKFEQRINFKNNKYIILGPEGKTETLYRENGLDKCFMYTPNTYNHNLCMKSKNYETGQLNKLDLNAQFYLTSHLLKKIKNDTIKLDTEDKKKLNEFYEELKYKCNNCKTPDYTLYRVEPTHIKTSFLTNIEAKENYEWLAGFVFKNNIQINDDFIFTNFKYLNDNSDVFDSNLVATEPALNLTDVIECDIPGNEFYERLNVTPLNDFITKDLNCGKSYYLDSFKDSFF